MFASSQILALAIHERGISCAQVAAAGNVGKKRRGGLVVQKLAYFPIASGRSFDDADALGRELREFLRTHGFTAPRAIIGAPAKWIIAQDRELPPTDWKQAAAMLRLQAETLSAAGDDGVIFDVAGTSDAAKPSRVMLVGMMRQQIDRIKLCCDTAGLTPVAIMPTALAFAGTVASGDQRPVVVWSRHGADVVWQVGNAPRMLRHLAGADASTAAVAGELRRTFALASAGAGREIIVWNERQTTPADIESLAERSGLQIKSGRGLAALDADVEPTALNGDTERLTAESYLPAIALASCGVTRQCLDNGVNFLRPRLAPPIERRFGQRTMLVAGMAIVGVLLLAGLYFAVAQTESEAKALDGQLAALQPDLVAATTRIDRVGYGRGYYQSRTPVLDCLREITLAIHPEEPIWTTSFRFAENGKGMLQGKASDQQVVLTVLDRLKASEYFQEVQLLDMHESAGSSSGDVVFSMTFEFDDQTR